jgi:hypothetical protein
MDVWRQIIVCGATIDVLVKMILLLVRVELLHVRIAIMKDRVVSTTVKRTQKENHSMLTAIHALAITGLLLAQKWLV